MNENEYTGGAYSSANAGSSDAKSTDETVYSSHTNVGSTGNNNANDTGYQRGGYQGNTYQTDKQQTGYQNNGYQGTGYQGNRYQNTGYQEKNYQNTGYQGTVNQGATNQSTYNGSYRDAYGYGNSTAAKTPKQKKPLKLGKFGKKLAIAVSLGLFFGVFAGVSFLAVKSATDLLQPKSEITASADIKTGDSNNEIAKAGENQTNDNAATNQTTTTVVTDVTQVVENVMPSVVSVTNNFIQKQQDFFGQTLESQESASGSGIIVGQSDKELLIATNYHVVEGADSLKVQFIDGKEADAQMKGSDSGMDLAVMAVQLDSLSSDTKNKIVIAKLGDSDSLKVGEPAIAIGNSLGYGQSVTTGVISATNRSIVDATNATPTGTGSKSGTSLIQTDAAINPGNSGGALLNMNGEVVGINSNKIGGSVVEGMGYAIPVSAAKPIIEDLMTKTTKMKATDGEKAYLGISGVDVTAEAAGTYGLPEGVYVAQVYEGTAASNAGLVKGDIITKFDGSSVNSMEELQNMLQYYSAGTTVDVTIQQGSPAGYQEKTIAITLGTKPEQQVQ